LLKPSRINFHFYKKGFINSQAVRTRVNIFETVDENVMTCSKACENVLCFATGLATSLKNFRLLTSQLLPSSVRGRTANNQLKGIVLQCWGGLLMVY
jgi:hypothetical protein